MDFQRCVLQWNFQEIRYEKSYDDFFFRRILVLYCNTEVHFYVAHSYVLVMVGIGGYYRDVTEVPESRDGIDGGQPGKLFLGNSVPVKNFKILSVLMKLNEFMKKE